MKKILGFFLLMNLFSCYHFVLGYETRNQMTEEDYRKEQFERRLQDRLFQERRATELPHERNVQMIREKKAEQGWDYYERTAAADEVQDSIDAYKRQQSEVQQKELEQKRIDEKVRQQELERKRVEDRIYRQQLENKRLEDARIRRQIEDREWERRHRR